MSRPPRRLLPLLLFTAVLAACAGPQPPGPTNPSVPSGSTGVQPKRITAAVIGEPPTLSTKVNIASAGGVVPGADAVEELVNGGLAHLDAQGNLVPQLAEAVPSLENGLWKLLPDGQMETTWSLKPSAQWHDGTPVTADDLLFAARVGQDGDLPAFGHPGFAAVQSIVAMDQRTVTVRWSRLYTGADTMFTAVSPAFALPLPAHLLAAPYRDNKAGFLDLPYWSAEFIGSGPFKLSDWQQASHLLLAANDDYVLGRPTIDEIDVRFIPDPNTMATGVLAGTVDLTLGRTLSLDQALQVRDQWSEGRVENTLRNWMVIYPQMLNPTPAVVADVRFRRALLEGIVRQQLVDAVQAGQVPVAHSYVSPAALEYHEIEDQVVRYEYDPAATARTIDAIGYTKGADGFFRNAARASL